MQGEEDSPDPGAEPRQDPIRDLLLSKRGLSEADRDAVRRQLFVVEASISVPGFRPSWGDALTSADLPDRIIDLLAAAVELRRLTGAFEDLRIDDEPISEALDRLRRGLWTVARQMGVESSQADIPPTLPDRIVEYRDRLGDLIETTRAEAREEDGASLRSMLEEEARKLEKEAERVEQRLADARDPEHEPNEDPDLRACRRVAERVREFELRADIADEIVDNAGFRFDPDTRLLDRVPGEQGGRPRRLLRDLVEAVLEVHEGPLRMDTDLRAWVRDQLRSIFPIDVLESEELRSAVDNATRSLRES